LYPFPYLFRASLVSDYTVGVSVRQGKGVMTTYWLHGASPALRRQDNDQQNKVLFTGQKWRANDVTVQLCVVLGCALRCKPRAPAVQWFDWTRQ